MIHTKSYAKRDKTEKKTVLLMMVCLILLLAFLVTADGSQRASLPILPAVILSVIT